ncbi:50S ribosomal protein L11 [Mycoplasmopsis columbina SF7]|uniref:Large ribosomal subunit protein uL11 n=1 Tax=Mycoplasmopsis columbina SF7 TaxID=1037410 RepID=F9UJ73_9BACT|nr:50S ribosomal protein L11 [Mycoplasmopsis columbina]EGV00569.1 50S ribosomal protein L11 [Mycoplasmopsis columbina SF7]VEU77181.1 50S ribosomal protein L11 [Mycoplasmopsis columbina]
MAKSKADIVRVRKLQFLAGQAKPGPALAGVGINMPDFTRAFNDATRDRGNEPVPVAITVYKDKSFDFKLFTAPASFKLKQAAKITSGSSNAKTTKVASITVDQLREIAEYKLPDLSTDNVEAAMRTIAGTAKQMGITIEGYDPKGESK